MTECNSTLGTYTVEPCRCDLTIGSPDYLNHDPVSLFNEDRGEYEHVTLHTLTCDGQSLDEAHLSFLGERWYDDTRGATPHAEPESDKRVTGKMLGDAQNAHQKLVGHYMPHDAMKAVLKAALAAQDTEGNTP
jgi:hypothetical protein